MIDNKEVEKTFEVKIDDQGFMRVTFFEDIIDAEKNVRRAELVAKDVYKILDEDLEKKFNILIDISYMVKSHISPKANEIYRYVARRDQVVKVAVVGNSDIQSRVLSFIMPFVTGEGKKVLWFPSEQEAIAWFDID
jgi:hypothetical protein